MSLYDRQSFSSFLNSSTSGLGTGSSVPVDSRLGEENKGHQMLMKMGKTGLGLCDMIVCLSVCVCVCVVGFAPVSVYVAVDQESNTDFL